MRAKNGRPLSFSIMAPTSSPQRMRLAVLLQEQFRGVGVQTEIQNLEFNAVQERLDGGRFDATLYAGAVCDYGIYYDGLVADPAVLTEDAVVDDGASADFYARPED